jgi:hemin uptake protein HemP
MIQTKSPANHPLGTGQAGRVETASKRDRFVSLSSETLFGPSREVRIEHNGEIYRLQKTRTQKLILTK